MEFLSIAQPTILQPNQLTRLHHVDGTESREKIQIQSRLKQIENIQGCACYIFGASFIGYSGVVSPILPGAVALILTNPFAVVVPLTVFVAATLAVYHFNAVLDQNQPDYNAYLANRAGYYLMLGDHYVPHYAFEFSQRLPETDGRKADLQKRVKFGYKIFCPLEVSRLLKEDKIEEAMQFAHAIPHYEEIKQDCIKQATPQYKEKYKRTIFQRAIDGDLEGACQLARDVPYPAIQVEMQEAAREACNNHYSTQARLKLQENKPLEAKAFAEQIKEASDLQNALMQEIIPACDAYCIEQIKAAFPEDPRACQPDFHLIAQSIETLSSQNKQEMIDFCQQQYHRLAIHWINIGLLKHAQSFMKEIQCPILKAEAERAFDQYEYEMTQIEKHLQDAPKEVKLQQRRIEAEQNNLNAAKELIPSLLSDGAKQEAKKRCDQFCIARLEKLIQDPAKLTLFNTTEGRKQLMALRERNPLEAANSWTDQILDPETQKFWIQQVKDVRNTYCLEQIQSAFQNKDYATASDWEEFLDCPQDDPIRLKVKSFRQEARDREKIAQLQTLEVKEARHGET